MNAIETRGLNLWYGEFQALRDVNFHIEAGAIVALIGPSGCGKTTLLRCCNRINERNPAVKTEGEVHILGKNIYDADVSLLELRKTVGMVFQRPNPLPISIYENIVFGLRLHAPPESRRRADLDVAVEKALTETGLWDDVKDKLDQPALALQLEQQQKLCIARLLPLQPEILLMDEPCAALDTAGTESIEELIRRWKGIRASPFRSNRRTNSTRCSATVSNRQAEPEMPAFAANVNATASQATVLISSSLLGNFAMKRWPSRSRTEAFGRAPPSEEPGASSNRKSSSLSSSWSTRSTAESKRGSSTNGGILSYRGGARKGPPVSAAKRRAPCRASSSTMRR